MFGRALTAERNGMPLVKLLSSDSHHQAEIFLHGATITSWIRSGEERLYLSGQAIFNGEKAIRGGVPLVFPQFSRPDPSMPQHGFIRTAKWSFLGSTEADDSITAYFRLTNQDIATSWSHQFAIIYEVTLTAETLLFTLRVFNCQALPFSFQALLHSYIRVPRIEDISVHGLQGFSYTDKLDGNSKKIEDGSSIRIDREVDRIYEARTEKDSVTVAIEANGMRFLSSDSYSSFTNVASDLISMVSSSTVDDIKVLEVRLRESDLRANVQSTDVVVWNAWVEKAKMLDDLEDNAYLHYVCIEPGLVSHFHELSSNSVFTLSQKLY